MLANNWSVLDEYDAASDISVTVVFRELHVAFPGSKFILTVREETSWLASCERNFGHQLDKYDGSAEEQVFVRTYGVNHYEREGFIAAKQRHERDVLEYFAERPRDLLIMDIAGGNGWSSLCSFVGVEAPDLPFPAANRSTAPLV